MHCNDFHHDMFTHVHKAYADPIYKAISPRLAVHWSVLVLLEFCTINLSLSLPFCFCFCLGHVYKAICLFVFKTLKPSPPQSSEKVPLTAPSSLQTFNPCHQMLIHPPPSPQLLSLHNGIPAGWGPLAQQLAFPVLALSGNICLAAQSLRRSRRQSSHFLARVCSSLIPSVHFPVRSDLSGTAQHCGIWEASPSLVLFSIILLIVLGHLLSHVWFSTTPRNSRGSHCCLT